MTEEHTEDETVAAPEETPAETVAIEDDDGDSGEPPVINQRIVPHDEATDSRTEDLYRSPGQQGS